jgi:hypothetical protein
LGNSGESDTKFGPAHHGRWLFVQAHFKDGGLKEQRREKRPISVEVHGKHDLTKVN